MTFEGYGPREELLLALHRGPMERPRWRGFLSLLRHGLSLSYTNLIFRHGRTGRSVLSEFFDGAEDMRAARVRYRKSFAAVDPFPYHAMRVGRAYRLEDLLQTETPSDHSFYREFLAPSGLGRLISARIVEPSGYVAWLTICRAASAPDFDDGEQRLFESLLPHMDVALHTFAVHERHKVHAAIARHVSTRLDFAAVALSSIGEVIGVGPGAAAIMHPASAFAIGPDGRLTIKDASANRRLNDAVRATAGGEPGEAFVIDSNDERIEILVAPFPSTSTFGSARPDAVVYLRREHGVEDGDHARKSLMGMFGLTAIESGIAMGLARGRTMIQLANDLALTESTVRSYTKSIYGKLGVRRQVDLVRLLLHSVALLA